MTAEPESEGRRRGGCSGGCRSAASPRVLKDVDRADSYKGQGTSPPTLTRTSAGLVELAYTQDWVANAGPAVASTLPVTTDALAMPGGAIPAFFTGLLPEGRRLAELRAGVKTSAADELSLLLGIGSDTVGDVQVIPRVSSQRPRNQR